MDKMKILSVLALLTSVGTALAVPLADLNPKYAIGAGVIAAVGGAVGKSLTEATDNHIVTVIGVIVAGVTAVIMFSGIDTILPAKALAILTNAAALLAALGRGISGGVKGDA